MKYSIFTKFVAIVLCAVSLVVCAAGAAGIYMAEQNGLYSYDADQWLHNQLEDIGHDIARDYCALYAAEHLGGCTEEILEVVENRYFFHYRQAKWSADLYHNGELLETSGTRPDNHTTLTYDVAPTYPTIHETAVDGADYTENILLPGSDGTGVRLVKLYFTQNERFQVTVYLERDVIDAFQVSAVQTLYGMRYHFITMVVVGTPTY